MALTRRSYLFLQGPATDFFGRLGKALAARGHRVAGVSFCVGDVLLWRDAGALHAHRGRVEALAPALEALIEREAVTDLVMLGDTRPVHAVAQQVARARGLVTHVWEEGYVRPHWLTLERGGINGYSRLPRDPAWYRTVAARLGPAPQPKLRGNPVWLLGAWELAYKLPGVLNPLLYPGYRTHRPQMSPLEFMGWGWRFAWQPLRERRDRARWQCVRAGDQPVFLLPLQLDGDGQITHHSPFGTVARAIETVVQSFARHAPTDAILVVKNHPLDTGWSRHARQVRRWAERLGVADRVVFFETGHWPEMLARCAGVVVVNSTVGTLALAAGVPVVALGKAVYDLPGLTHQGGLDAFWRAPTPPDAELFAAFFRVVVHATQVPGSFYRRAGQDAAIAAAVPIMEAPQSPLEALL